MRTLFTVVLGVAASMMASAAFAQARTPPSYNQAAPVPAASQSLAARAVPVNPAQTANEPYVLFHIGNVPVRVWAPVQAPYNAHMNRNAAANPMWEAEASAL